MSDPGDTAPRQEVLFTDGLDPVPDELVGYRGTTACHAAGITYRQLDYWARTNLVVPSVRSAAGSGTQRLYSFKDILVLKVVKRLLDTGVSLHNIRVAVDHLRARGVRRPGPDHAALRRHDGVRVHLGRGGRRPARRRAGRLRHRGERGAQGAARVARGIAVRAGGAQRERRRVRAVGVGRARAAPAPAVRLRLTRVSLDDRRPSPAVPGTVPRRPSTHVCLALYFYVDRTTD